MKESLRVCKRIVSNLHVCTWRIRVADQHRHDLLIQNASKREPKQEKKIISIKFEFLKKFTYYPTSKNPLFTQPEYTNGNVDSKWTS